MKKKTWTNGVSVNLPIQASRGYSRTMMGAIGMYYNKPADQRNFRFIYMTAAKTNIETVKEFLTHIFNELPVKAEEAVVFADNHSAHKSDATQAHA